MTPLEQRYRAALRRLPASYRRQWEDDMVATFLASQHSDDPEEAEYRAECGRPSRGERASIARLALRLRLGGTTAAPRAFAWGQGVRLAGLVLCVVNAALAAVGLWHTLWTTRVLAWPTLPTAVAEVAPAPFTLLDALLGVSGLLWVAVVLSLLRARTRWALPLAVAACAPGVVAAVTTTSAAVQMGLPAFVLTRWALTAVVAAPLLTLPAFHRDSPRMVAGPWLAAVALTVPVAGMLAYVLLQQANGPIWLDLPGALAVAAVGGALWHLLSGARPQHDIAATILCAAALSLRVLSLLDLAVLAGNPGLDALAAAGAVQGLILSLVMVALVRRLRVGLATLSTEVPLGIRT